jgi:hypothetical protein
MISKDEPSGKLSTFVRFCVKRSRGSIAAYYCFGFVVVKGFASPTGRLTSVS